MKTLLAVCALASTLVQAAPVDTAAENALLAATRKAEHILPPAPRYAVAWEKDQKDASALLAQVRKLGEMGTPRTLRMACGYLRSPLQANPSGSSERSIRREALQALRHNYPDEPALDDPDGHEGWIAAEQFCTRTLGVAYQGPTPERHTDRAYPHR